MNNKFTRAISENNATKNTKNRFTNTSIQIVKNQGIIGNASTNGVKLSTSKFEGFIDFGFVNLAANIYYELVAEFDQTPTEIKSAVTDESGSDLSIKNHMEGNKSVAIVHVQSAQTARIRLISTKKQDIMVKNITFDVSQAQLIDYHQANSNLSSFEQIYLNQLPSVVQIVGFVGGLIGSGTGFFINNDGLIATAAHVVNDLLYMHVEFHHEDEVVYKKATLVGMDIRADVAVISVDMDSPSVPVKWAESDFVTIGSPAILIGQPQGSYDFSFSKGIVRDNSVFESTAAESLKLDTPLTSGNSGGPVFNQQGKCIGIVSYSSPYQNYGGAVPSTVVQPIIDKIVASGGDNVGSFLGIAIRPITGIDLMINEANIFSELHHVHGIFVTDSINADLLKNDIITHVDGVVIGIHRFHASVFRLIHLSKPSTSHVLTVLRNNAVIEKTVTVQSRPAEYDKMFTVWL